MTTLCECVCGVMNVRALSAESVHLYLHVCMCFVCEVAAVCVSGVRNLSDAVGAASLRNTLSGCVSVCVWMSKFGKSCHHKILPVKCSLIN